MGRLGPLTSQALGRSPYDDVVPGEGEPDDRGPQQLYDERGRPINPETRRINRDVIRSHNEVMLVIGVAEPENESPELKIVAAKKRQEYEEVMGGRLFLASGILETAGVWGVNGMRQRILLYRQYAAAPFRDMYRLNRSNQSVASYFFSGLPSFLASNIIEQVPILDIIQQAPVRALIRRVHIPSITWRVPAPGIILRAKKNAEVKLGIITKAVNLRPLLKMLNLYVGLHLDIFTFMQRVGIAPPRAILPNWKFFMPGSSLSPIYIPPFPSLVGPCSILRWLGGCAMGILPFVGYYFFTRISKIATLTLCRLALRRLPYPDTPRQNRDPEDTPPSQAAAADTRPPSAGASNVGGPRHGRDLARDEPTYQILEGQSQNEALPVGTTRRQSAVSVRGDEFASDDEETEVVSATLISFDVEATESTDTTPGVWSAELRPNLADIKASANNGPKFRDASLYRLPPILAADAIGVPLARVLLAPFESQTLLGLARLFSMRGGVSPELLHPPGIWGFLQSFSWRRMANVIGFEMVFLIMQGEAWGLMMMAAEFCRYTDEEWEERIAEENATQEETEESEET
ncbi:hypothetical protein B0T14DRAFT_600319 [Immersiella caudata]|uniref:Uncharacterized protein n=1 Tax=Immersiella caudata TaxID=314043 RepID=A0AA40C720_9PEZI|nr:hypothetical protein B0T14DRAFT_600319 [Immersiella caudata]